MNIALASLEITAKAIDGLIDVLRKLHSLSGQIDDVGRVLVQVLKSGNKVLTCGNGGSAADALHMAEELVGRYKHDRRSLPAVALCADPAGLTCIANDYGFDHVFSRQIEGLSDEGDVLVMFSSSGNSTNLLRAMPSARLKKVITVSLLGKGGGAMAGLADYEIIVPSNETARVQEIHTLILHSWLEQIDAAFPE